MEVESALVEHEAVAEAAVVGVEHPVKGQGIAAFVTLMGGREGSDELAAELRGHVADSIGAIARPEVVLFAADLPKTRSGKIMRRLLGDIAAGRAIGDTTTLARSRRGAGTAGALPGSRGRLERPIAPPGPTQDRGGREASLQTRCRSTLCSTTVGRRASDHVVRRRWRRRHTVNYDLQCVTYSLQCPHRWLA